MTLVQHFHHFYFDKIFLLLGLFSFTFLLFFFFCSFGRLFRLFLFQYRNKFVPSYFAPLF
ncbi:hypothetical protein CKO19_16720 [Rhodovulum adriaticum]|nr:hypothetical protein [Rhodovulum adriaticum]